MQDLLTQLTRIADALAPASLPATDWSATAYRWRKKAGQGYLESVLHPHQVRLESLKNIEPQKIQVLANTQQFVSGKPANNVLLTGGRGTGKSSLIKAMLHEFSAHHLRLVEIDRTDLVDLPDVIETLYGRPERFIVFCDDLSFDEGDDSYKALKSALDGTISAPGENVVIYATSNRRHLLPEYFEENAAGRKVGEEIHPAEAVDDKIALSERFGLWLSFYPFSQQEYLAAVSSWLTGYGILLTPENERLALQWAQARGGRSGRIAWQFARDLAGKHAMETNS